MELEFIGILLIVLVIVTVVGHALWLLAAAVISAMTAKLEPHERPTPRSFSATPPPSPAPPVTELEEFIKRANHLYSRGILDTQQHASITDIILAEQRKQRAAAEVPKPVAQPTAQKEEPTELIFEDEPAPPQKPAVSPQPQVVEEASSQPSEPLTDMLRAFMEQRNIRWGEIVSGLLIVGSSIGLVISLWATLRDQIPYFPALLFLLGTAAIHGAGVYTMKKWKLRSTSRGLLVIAALLIPLNYLAAIALSEIRSITDPYYIASVCIGTLAFAGMAYSGGRMLLLRGTLPYFVALCGISSSQLLIARQLTPAVATETLLVIMAVPLGCYLFALLAQLWQALQWQHLTARRTGQIFLLLGISTFTLMVSLGLSVWKTQDLSGLLTDLSPLLSIALIPALGLGLLIQRQATAPRISNYQIAGTSVALFAAAMMIAMLFFAWPSPQLLIMVGLIDFLALTLLAVRAEFELLHVPATAALALAGLLGFHALDGSIDFETAINSRELWDVLLMGRSAVVLTGFTLVIAGVAGGLQRMSKTAIATAYLYSSAGLAVVSLLIATYAGFISGVDRDWTTPVFAISAAVLLLANSRIRQSWLAYAGSGFVFICLIHGLILNEVLKKTLESWTIMPDQPFLMACLLHATFCCVTALAIWRRPKPVSGPTEGELSLWSGFSCPLSISALISTTLAIPLILYTHPYQFAAHAAYGFWVSAIWLAVAFLWESRWGFAAAQALASVALGFLVTAICRNTRWWENVYLDPRHLQAQMVGFAIWAMLWAVLRSAAGKFPRWRALWNYGTSVDRVLLGALTVASVLLVTAGCVPGIDSELRLITAVPQAVGISGVLIGMILLISVGLVVAASLALIRKRRIALFSGLSVLTAFWVLPFWDDLANQFWMHVDVTHAYAYGPQSWAVFTVIVLGILIALWERYSTVLVAGLLFLSLSVPLLIAGPFAAENATATVLRWGLAVHGLVIAIIICLRRYWLPAVQKLYAREGDELSDVGFSQLRSFVLTLTLTPVLALTLRQIVLLAGSGHHIAGPLAESFWAGISPAWSLGAPLLVISIALWLYAVRERSLHFSIAASLTLNLAASVAVVLRHWSAETSFEAVAYGEFFQWNALVCSVCALVCLAARRWIEPANPEERWSALNLTSPLEFQVLLACGMSLLVAAWATVIVIYSPGQLPDITAILGRPLSYLAFSVAAISAGLFYRDRKRTFRISLVPAGGLALMGLAAASCAKWNSTDSWVAYHVLLGGWIAVSVLSATGALLLTYAVRLRDLENWQAILPAAVRWATAVGGAVLLLATRCLWEDPDTPFWSVVAVGIIALMAAALGVRGRSQKYAHASTILAVLATAFAWLRPWLVDDYSATPQSWLELCEACLSALAAAGIVWLAIEVFWQRRLDSVFDLTSNSPPAHHTAAGIGLLGMILLVSQGLIAPNLLQTQPEEVVDISNFGAWLTVAGLGTLLLGSFWDSLAQHVIWGLYTLGLVVTGLILHELDLSGRYLVYGIGIVSAGTVLLSGAAWSLRRQLAALGYRLKIRQSIALLKQTEEWLPWSSLLATAVCVLIAFWSVLTFKEQHLRLYAAGTVGLTACGIVAFAQQERRFLFQLLTLLLATIAAIDFGWGLMDVSTETVVWLHRAVRFLVVVAGVTFLYGLTIIRFLPPASTWYRSMKSALGVSTAASLVSLLVVLSLEAYWFVPVEGAPISVYEFWTVVVVLVAFIVGLIALAALPGWDPLQLSERRRMLYVYAAEVVAALLFLHIYLAMPEWFHGRIRPYWPLVVMSIAFFGIGVGELMSRMKQRVLAEPLQQTGVFLPLLPALGFWTLQSRVEYSTVLFVVGLLYVVASMWRKKFWHSVAAGLAGNAGLWALWHEQGTELFEHPQLWMIPPALSVLAAAQWHRAKLSETQLTALRYASIIVVYVSSTGDMFITGIAESLWMPVILASLSVAGVLAGIMLHVRAFVYLGASFLFVSLVSMVWHAAQNINHVWPWWAFGIVLGLLILTLFGVFEKKRKEVLGLIGEFRQWEA